MAKGLKTGGRRKGTSNKLTGTTKEMISQFIENEIQQLPTLLNQMEPKEKAEYIIKLLPYILPKMAPMEAPKIQNPNNGIPKHKLFAMQFEQNQLAKKMQIGV